MDIRRIREELRLGRSIFDLPLRVTFYARVSTDKDEQINSLENQVQYYTELIRRKPNWVFVPGYMDEGISGTSTRKRDSFNRMIADAKAGRFDFIITKEISRFSRSTLDSIQYTQELLAHNVGVLFENDNINTLDADSEFRLVIMAGVAQDEVRKLSERLKFGFRQAIRNGHVLGNDSLWGYDKKDCRMTVNEEEAEIIRTIFDLYANRGLGVRKISQTLYDRGVTSREGNAFNVATIRHILTNPKYKGWYCGNKSQTVDYRTKRKVLLAESEWITYRDPSIPAIVPEELWDRANAMYKARSRESMARTSAASYHRQYAYSAKIFCEEHGVTFHRQVLKSSSGEREVWQCRVYRQRGRQACSAPQICTEDLNRMMGCIFAEILTDRQIVLDALRVALQRARQNFDPEKVQRRLREELERVYGKKDRLLELHIAGILSAQEFGKRNDSLNEQAGRLRDQIEEAAAAEHRRHAQKAEVENILEAAERELACGEEVDARLAAAVLDRVIVKRESTKEEICLDILLKTGHRFERTYKPRKRSFRSSL